MLLLCAVVFRFL